MAEVSNIGQDTVLLPETGYVITYDIYEHRRASIVVTLLPYSGMNF